MECAEKFSHNLRAHIRLRKHLHEPPCQLRMNSADPSVGDGEVVGRGKRRSLNIPPFAHPFMDARGRIYRDRRALALETHLESKCEAYPHSYQGPPGTIEGADPTSGARGTTVDPSIQIVCRPVLLPKVVKFGLM